MSAVRVPIQIQQQVYERGHHLEELQQAHAGDLVAIDLFLRKLVGMQQSRDETLQFFFKLWRHI